MQRRSSLPNEQATEHFGAELARTLPDSAVVYLSGDLGAGKTTSIRGLLRALGYQKSVKSPTYSLVESYTIGSQLIHHFDLYRIEDPEELVYIGIDDYFNTKACCFIEWAEQGRDHLPPCDLQIVYSHHGLGRCVQLVAETPIGEKWLSALHLSNEG